MELNADSCSISNPSHLPPDDCSEIKRILDYIVPKCEISHVLDKVNEECVTFHDPHGVTPPELDDSEYWWSLQLIFIPPTLPAVGWCLLCWCCKKKETSATQVEVQSAGNSMELDYWNYNPDWKLYLTTHRDRYVLTPMGHGILESQDKNPNAHGLYVLKVRLAWGIMYVPSLQPDPRLAGKETGDDTVPDRE